ncbi:MAG: class I poly(R)-hydroxyalkanoic acid synthase, partial [Alphaproteobacteria bacterium]|nr:class I poly(R)-hydroxyalkanoic acid synthase [Alphaproteobacteria bacterium]
MADKNPIHDGNREVLNANLEKIETLTQRLVAALANKPEANQALEGPGQELYLKAATAYVAEMMQNPAKMMEQQVSFWGKSLKHYVQAQESLASGTLVPEDHSQPDRRFKNAMWDTHPYFNYIKQQYLLSAEAIENAVDGLDELGESEKKKVSFFTRQIVDMMSPTNFLGSNPEALQKAVETDGQSLVDGLENLVNDIESHDGSLAVTLADPKAFEVGGNIATSEGAVVFQNRMFQLIQYAPKTDKVHKTPLIIFPPWINKFYILDLKPKNSLIKWAVEQGFTVFVTSWINPDATYADVGIDTYINEGFLTAIDEVKKITAEPRVNVVGYC